MADERVACSGSSCRFEQLSCTKYFHLSYELFNINFQRFNQFLTLQYLIKFKILNNYLVKCTQYYTQSETDWWVQPTVDSAVKVDQVNSEQSGWGPSVIVKGGS